MCSSDLFEEYEIMIPRMFGVEVKKNIKSGGSSERRKWTKEEFLQYAREKYDAKTHKAVEDLLNFSYQNSDKVTYGTGNEGLFSYKLNTINGIVTPFYAKADGFLQFNLGFLKTQEKIPSEITDSFIEELKKIKGVKEDYSFEKDIKCIKLIFEIGDLENETMEGIKKSVGKFTKKVKNLK